ncbi:helix-turn-helix transcriptional regulator [Halorussus lipolyticus]|uniref:helix-turn-helix transcriptional regulator n=1 Tax=Halorussus lipolyticus TaxID=3034024 RepID=UPI0023E8A0AB|nr:hypothetical protein [Halorussus sp. DT80]
MPDSQGFPDSNSMFTCLIEYADLVEALRDGPRRKQALVDRLGVSPETVYRRTRDLRDAGLLERTQSGYALTNLGRLYAREYDSVQTFARRLHEARDLLEHFATDELPPRAVFRNADITTVEQYAPDRPSRWVERAIRRTRRFRGLLPVLPRRLADALGASRSSETRTDVILDADVADHYRADTDFAETFDRESAGLYLTDEQIPYGILLVDCENGDDTTLALTVYDEQGVLRGVVVNDDRSAVSWGERRYERYRAEATPAGS